jgi:hypothetical protein
VTVFFDGTTTVRTRAIELESGDHTSATTLSICGVVARSVQFSGSATVPGGLGRSFGRGRSELTLERATDAGAQAIITIATAMVIGATSIWRPRATRSCT